MSDFGGGPGLSAAEQAFRNSAIIAKLRSGEKVKDVAAAYGLTVRQVHRISTLYEARPTLLGEDPMVIIVKVIRDIEDRRLRLALMAAHAVECGQLSVALGALKADADAQERQIELLRALGQIPKNLRTFRSESEVLQMGASMLGVIERAKRGEVSLDEGYEQIIGWLTAGGPRPEPAHLPPGESE